MREAQIWYSRSLKACRDITALLRLAGANIPACEDLWRRACQRLFLDCHVRLDFILHLNGTRRVDGMLLGIGCHGSHLIALKHHAIVLARRVLRDERGLNARHAIRHRQVHRHNARVWIWRADNARIQHSRARNVEGVLGTAGHLIGPVQAFDARA